MEKLQKALQKARDQRSGTPDKPVMALRSSSGGMPPRAGSDPDTLWAELRSFEPEAAALEKGRIVTASSNKVGTHFDILRTKIQLSMRKNGWKRLAVTSPTMGCGKSTTACNLVIGSARNADIRTILFEFDLRRPSIARTLGLPDGPEITDLFMRRVDFSGQALRYRDNVAVAAARSPTVDPTAILQSRTTQEVIDDIEARYAPDLMIFDLPPLLVGDDARAVLKDMDCALLLARAGATTINQIDSCEREIAEQTNVMGILLNQCRDSYERYDYYY
jgi:protein-tyrosine kinase